MESSTPPIPSSASASSSGSGLDNQALDPLALPNEHHVVVAYNNDNGSQDHPSTTQQSNTTNICSSDKNLNDGTMTVTSNGAIYAQNNGDELHHHHQQQHHLHMQQQAAAAMQFETNQIGSNHHHYGDVRKLNHHMSMPPHEPHNKTFSHSIENLSKTTEKCNATNDMKMYPNLIDGHEYDDGYETGVGDLMSVKYKLPSLPPPSSSPYSSLSSSSMSTISTATTTPTNLVNPQQQQQSPSYMGGGNAGNNMNHYQQQQYLQNQQQYPSIQHQNHMNSFNYHPFGRMQQQQQQQTMSNVIKSESDNDPYRFVDDDLSNGLNYQHHQQQHMPSPANYSASSSPMPPQQQQQQQPSGNTSMMQFNEHQMSSPHHHHHHQMHGHMNHVMQQQQQQQQQQHLMNGNASVGMSGHLHGASGMNSSTTTTSAAAAAMLMMNDTPKKRGRKKKMRDENGNPIEDERPTKERKKHDRFNGMPEEEVSKRTIPDHLTHNLDIVIVGINPGLFAAYKGHHYAGPGNHFWKCLYLSGLTAVQMTAEEDYKLMQYGIGFTNMVARPTKGSADLTRKEIKDGARILLEKIQKFQPKIAVFNGKLIFEVFSGKKDFCFGKQPETVEGTNTYMWVMPSSSARCAQLPRAADKVPFYAALKKFRDYLNGQVVDYDESEYVFNDPKYNGISTEAELKNMAEESLAFTALNENGEVITPVETNKKKRGRPKKVRGENGEEIPTPSRRKKQDKSENPDGADEDPSKKKRGRPKKPKDGTTATATKKRGSNKKAALENQPSTDNDVNSMSSNLQSSPHHISSLPPNTNSNTNGSNSNSFLPPMESPPGNNSNQNTFQSGALSQNSTPPVDCLMSIEQQVAPPEISPHQTTYQQRPTSNHAFSDEMANEIVNDPIQSPAAASPSLQPSDFEPPQAATSSVTNAADLNPYPQQSSVDHHHHSPLAQSPLGMYQQQQAAQQQAMAHHQQQMMNSPSYSPYSRQQQTSQQNFMQSSLQQQQQQPNPTQNVHSSKQQMGQMNGTTTTTTDIFKDIAAKSLSGLESLVDQIPNINEQDAALGSLAQSTGHPQNAQLQPNDSYPNLYSSPGTSVSSSLSSATVGGSSSLLPSLGPPHHYPYTSHAAAASQSPYSANPFSVSSLTSSTYPSAAAAAMNSYHQNLMGGMTSSFMEPPHMPVPVTPLYHSYQQQGYPGYPTPHHPSAAAAALHMSNYPYYTNTGYTQAPGSTHYSMFDRINF